MFADYVFAKIPVKLPPYNVDMISIVLGVIVFDLKVFPLYAVIVGF